MSANDPFRKPASNKQQQRRKKEAEKRARERARLRQPAPDNAATARPPLTRPANPAAVETAAPAWLTEGPQSAADGSATPTNSSWPGYVTACILACVAVAVAVLAGGNTLTGTWNWPWLAGGLIVAAAATWWAWRGWGRIGGGRGRWLVAGAAGLVCVFTVWGSISTVVINGRPYLVFSQEAQVYATSQELFADLQYIAQVDETLLTVDAVTARSRFDQYTPARDRLLGIASKWTDALAEGSLPADALRGPADATRSAAYWAAQAVDAKNQWVVSSDAKLEATVASYRTTVVQSFTAAGQQLREAAALFGIELVPGGGERPVE